MGADHHQYPKVTNTHFTNQGEFGLSFMLFCPNEIDMCDRRYFFYRGQLLQSHNKTTIMVADSLLIIMRHEQNGNSLLWPVFRQLSNDTDEGLLGNLIMLFLL